ncbi:MAG: hypothetical protein EU535_03850 [Promethearchaeota archaeon]|nr:MAG: hypothetical protein EU535_03850 [Candidatus Lokiarchaeota archaeon]
MYLIRFFPKYYQKKSEAINKILPLIQNCIELYLSFLPGTQDLSVIIVNFLANIPSPFQRSFKLIQCKVQKGNLPEELLSMYISPSSLFDTYLKTLIQSNFSKSKMIFQTETPLENKYSAKSHSLESRISISFFFGIFIPLGFSLGVFMQKINGIMLLSSSPVLFIVLYYLTKQMVKDNSLLLGTLTNQNKEIKSEYSEFWLFFYHLASNLPLKSPEYAVVHALESTSLSNIPAIFSLMGGLKAHSLSLDEFMERLHHNIKGNRTQMIFGTLKYMLSSSSMISSKNILKLLTLLKHHQRLETHRLITIKGEIFKVRVFQIILPIILALLTSIFLLITSIMPNTSYIFSLSLTLSDFVEFFINQLISVNISIFFFRRTVGLKNSILSVLTHTFLFLFVFVMSFFMFQTISIPF